MCNILISCRPTFSLPPSRARALTLANVQYIEFKWANNFRKQFPLMDVYDQSDQAQVFVLWMNCFMDVYDQSDQAQVFL